MRLRVTAVVFSALVIAACGSPRYTYVRNSSLKTAFRVPVAWETFDRAELLGESPGPQPDTPDPIEWLVGFDADPAPRTDHVLNPDGLNTEYPQGIALVQSFSWEDRDASSFASLRNYLFPVDQLLQNSNSAAVLAYDDTIDEDGVRGIHIVFQFRYQALEELANEPPPKGGADVSETLGRGGLGGAGAALLNPDFVTVNQTALVDAATDNVYVFAAMCSATCYERHRGDIEAVVNSWVVLS